MSPKWKRRLGWLFRVFWFFQETEEDEGTSTFKLDTDGNTDVSINKDE